jgi:FkbM family methyltransferase
MSVAYWKVLRNNDEILSEITRRHIKYDKNNVPFLDLGRFRLFYDFQLGASDQTLLEGGIGLILYESFIWSYFMNSKMHPSNGDVVFDIGAYVGTAALLVSEIIGTEGRVFCFEPVTFEILERNMTCNGIKNAKIVREAVSDIAGTTEINVSDYCGPNSSIIKATENTKRRSRKMQISATTIDDFCHSHDIATVDFIKMDIEGAEEQAILGAQDTIERYRPKWSIASYHVDSEGELQHPKLISLLRRLGYVVRDEPYQHIWAY